jgi:Zn-dependent protease with chaperone function
MNSTVDYKVCGKEQRYFYIKLVISAVLYFLIFWLIDLSLESDSKLMASVYIVYVYLILIIFYFFFRFGILIGHLKGNAIKVNNNQLPDIYHIVEKQSVLLGLRSVPDVYILQSGGVLNAFATNFLGKNYIVLYSEIVETAYEQDKNLLEFIIGHELGHIKRNHMIKRLLLMPSSLIPFLGFAYSRACEYTCDNIGYSLSPKGVRSGLLVLASGKSIFKRVNIPEYLLQNNVENGFWKWFSEKVSSHPNLTKRLACFVSSNEPVTIAENVSAEVKKEEDYQRFMPR